MERHGVEGRDAMRFFSLAPAALEDLFHWLFHAAFVRGSAYAPLSHARFVRCVRDRLPSTGAVVDVGCGCGDKLWAFHTLNPALDITGIECDPWAAQWARVLCPFAQIIEARGEDMDLSAFDLIYCWAAIPLAPHLRVVRP
jgi:trans-aconitate methyltransferase